MKAILIFFIVFQAWGNFRKVKRPRFEKAQMRNSSCQTSAKRQVNSCLIFCSDSLHHEDSKTEWKQKDRCEAKCSAQYREALSGC